MADEDFISRALSSLSKQMALANTAGESKEVMADEKYITLHKTVEAHAKSLVDDDTPKIDSAVKSYLSLVAARSAVASEIDVLSENVKSSDQEMKLNTMEMKSALACARKLLNGINTTLIPTSHEKDKNDSNENGERNDEMTEEKKKMMDAATKIVWNRLVENKDVKPSKVLGRKSLIVSWPFIQERFRRGVESNDESTDDSLIHSYGIDILSAITTPQGIDPTAWKAYYTEFGSLLSKACQNDGKKKQDDQDEEGEEDDSKLLWSDDKGVSELQQRRDRRAKRAEVLTQSSN